MKLRVGNLFAECPYCGSTEFLPAEDEDSRELNCAQCGGYASRQVVLERVGDAATELARAGLARLKNERRNRKRKPT